MRACSNDDIVFVAHGKADENGTGLVPDEDISWDIKRKRLSEPLGVITLPKRKPSGPLMTPSVAKAMVRTMAVHPLCQESIPDHLLKSLAPVVVEEATPDGRLRPLMRDERIKRDCVFKGDAEERQWDGIRIDGSEHWINDGVEIRVNGGTRKGVIRRVIQLRQSATNTKFAVHVHWLKSLAVGKRYDEGGAREYVFEDARCDTLSVHHIVRKLDFALVTPGHPVPASGLFCRFVAQSDYRIRDPIVDPTEGCDECDRIAQLRQSPRVRKDTLRLKDDVLHVHDFFMIDSGLTGEPFIIGQICDLARRDSVQIRVFERHAVAMLEESGFKDECRLITTPDTKSVKPEKIRGRCVVVSDPCDMSKHDDHPTFYCPSMQLTVNRRFRRAGMLKAADYYSGAGGGILSATPFFHVVSAVELNPVACNTLWHNFSRRSLSTAICMERLEVLHTRELELERGPYDPSSTTSPPTPRLPMKGSVAVMMGGIPWCAAYLSNRRIAQLSQGHSRANAHQHALDERNHELFYFISEVSRVQPAYVVLENVPGFKDTKDNGSFVSPADGTSFARVAIDLLMSEGYQSQLAVLDSRGYGSPQNRTRLWIIAAQAGLPLPNFPQPTHANPHAKASIFSLEVGTPKTAWYVEEGTVGTGPYSSITVRDAISDLPPFDFKLEGSVARRKVPAFDARSEGVNSDTKVGYREPVPYHTAPQSSYQHLMRGSRAMLKHHYTPSRGPAEIQKCHRAFEVDERDLHGSERRLRADGGFSTLLTSNSPGQRANRPIHYDQRRTKTIAEDKRAMGFPDDYHLSGSPKEQIAQLGNAWVVPMGTAILREIRNVIRAEWIKAGQPKDLETWWRRSSVPGS